MSKMFDYIAQGGDEKARAEAALEYTAGAATGERDAEITRRGALDMQVCVPADWTDDQVKTFADEVNPCGTENGWSIRKGGDKALAGDPERRACGTITGRVHIMLDA